MNRPAHYIKSIIVILLAVSINLPVFITNQYLEYQRKSIRKTVKAAINAGLREDQLTKLRFSKTDIADKISWEKLDEFEFEGKLYDIVKAEETTDSIVYFCWLDNDESTVKKLLNNISNYEWSKNKNRQNQQQRQMDYAKNLICPSNHFLDIKANFVNIEKKSECAYKRFGYENHILALDCPPPELYI